MMVVVSQSIFKKKQVVLLLRQYLQFFMLVVNSVEAVIRSLVVCTVEKKNADMIVANSLKTEGAGFGTDTNLVTLITKEGQTELPKMTKEKVAGRLLDEIRNRLDFGL